jgi:lipopolysaccharide biosynthesis protein
MTTSSSGIRAIAFYLPQFHPIPENDQWWGRGFTEWTNVAKAQPLFRGHYQPHVPADLGFYDLRVPETREAQAALARQAGIEAFCYWHYWFGNGRRLLQRPFEEVLASGKPDFPFCLGWANETWTGIWHGSPNTILMEQTYPGWDDYRRHFDFLVRAFHDRRYVRVDEKPMFVIYRPQHIPDCHKVMDFWRDLAVKAGLPGLHLVTQAPSSEWVPTKHGFDAATIAGLHLWPLRTFLQRVRGRMERTAVVGPVMKRLIKKPLHVYPYSKAAERLVEHHVNWEYYPAVLPNWDNTPRSGRAGVVYTGSTPELFRGHLRDAVAVARNLAPGHRIIIVKSWNEWAEGNHLEPDQRFGTQYLDVLRQELTGVTSEEHVRS